MGAIKYEQPIVGFRSNVQQDDILPAIPKQRLVNSPEIINGQNSTVSDRVTASNYDPLTGLLCRSAFEINRLAQGFEQDLVAAFIIDFDRFAGVNKKYGRAVGDFILAIQAERLQKSEVAHKRILYRYEGDRFLQLIFSDDIVNEITLIQMARELQQELRQPVKMKQSDVITTCCIGMALKDESKNAAQLATEALLAVEDAKLRGTGNIYLSELSIAD